jgi:hypothetical protein
LRLGDPEGLGERAAGREVRTARRLGQIEHTRHAPVDLGEGCSPLVAGARVRNAASNIARMAGQALRSCCSGALPRPQRSQQLREELWLERADGNELPSAHS